MVTLLKIENFLIMAEKRSNKEKATHLEACTESTQRGPGCWSAKGYTDQAIQERLNIDGLEEVCTELDMSDNLITQRGASMIAKFVQSSKVN